MNHLRLLATLFLLFSSFCCGAQTEKQVRIDEEYQACIGHDSSSANICNCAFVAYDKWNNEMDNAYKRLLKTLKKDKDKDIVKASQTAWLAYKNAEFKSYDNMFNIPGGDYCGMRQNGRIDIVRTRALQLRQYIEDLKKHAGKK